MTPQLFDLTERVVIVTGAAGQLGRQFTSALIQHGARVAALDLQPQQLEEAKQGYSIPDRVMNVVADVTQRSSLENALIRIREEWGEPFGLINNAGLDSPPGAPAADNGPFEEYPEESWDRVLEVNLKGVFLCCQVFGAAMAAEQRGAIVNIGSIYGAVSPDQRLYEYRAAGGRPFFKPVAYSASKSGLLNLTRYLATYWAHRGVRVNTLTLAGVLNNQDAEFMKEYCKRMPVGRMARPDEYNGAVVFLCSDAASYMTGSNVIIDGGWTSW